MAMNILEQIQTQEQSVGSKPRLLTATVVAATAINLCGAVTFVSQDSNNCESDNMTGVIASATYDVGNGNINTATGEIPDAHSENYQSFIPESINDPIIQLAAEKGSVTRLAARVLDIGSHNPPISGSYSSGGQCDTEKEIRIAFANNKEKNMYAMDYLTHVAVAHEAIHGLNDEWWQKLKQIASIAQTQDPSVYELVDACNNINRWILYQDNGRKLDSSALLSEELSVSQMCNTDDSYRFTDALVGTYRCVNEGHMIQMRSYLKNRPNLGHPWSNPTELASSVTNVLLLNPGYLMKCFANQDPYEATLVKQYVKAVLTLSLAYQPELEPLLRADPKSAEALDFLLAA